jgi:hypothetical protein
MSPAPFRSSTTSSGRGSPSLGHDRRGRPHVRFGPWHVRTPLTNLRAAQVTGPYSPLKAIEPRLAQDGFANVNATCSRPSRSPASTSPSRSSCVPTPRLTAHSSMPWLRQTRPRRPPRKIVPRAWLDQLRPGGWPVIPRNGAVLALDPARCRDHAGEGLQQRFLVHGRCPTPVRSSRSRPPLAGSSGGVGSPQPSRRPVRNS